MKKKLAKSKILANFSAIGAVILTAVLGVVCFLAFNRALVRFGEQYTFSQLETISNQATVAVNLMFDESVANVLIGGEAFSEYTEMTLKGSFSTHWEFGEAMRKLYQIENHTEFTHIALVDSDGFARMPHGYIGCLADDPLFLECKKGLSGISSSTNPILGSEQSIVAYAPILNNTKFCGALMGVYTPQAFGVLLNAGVTSSEKTISIVDARGRSVYSTNGQFGDDFLVKLTNAVFGKGFSFAKLSADLAAGKSGFTQYGRGGMEYLASYMPLNMPGWFVFTAVPLSSLSAQMESLSRGGLMLMLTMLIICLLLLFVFIISYRRRQRELEMFDSLAINSLVGIFKLRIGDFTFDYANNVLYQLFGCASDADKKSIRANTMSAIHPGHVARVKEILKKSVNSGNESLSFEMKCVKRDGSVFWSLVWGVVANNETEKHPYFTGCIIDITHQKQTEQELALLTNNIPSGITKSTTGREPKLKYASAGFAQMLGAEVTDITRDYNDDFYATIHPADVDKVKKEIMTQLHHGNTVTVNYRLNTLDGREVWVMDKHNYVLNNDGEPYFYSVITDITDTVKANEEIRVINECFRIACAHTAALVFIYDVRTKRVNILTELHGGYGLTQQMENVPDCLLQSGTVRGEDASALAACFNAVSEGLEQSEVVFHAYPLINAPETWRKLELVSVRGASGEISRAVGILKDITDEVENEMKYQSEKQYRYAIIAETNITLDLNLTQDVVLEEYIQPGVGASTFTDETCTNAIARIASAIHPDDSEAFADMFTLRALLVEFSRGNSMLSLECRIKWTDFEREWQWANFVIHILTEPKSGDVIAYFYAKDITDEKLKELELKKMAEQDHLTQLYNRSAMTTHITEALQADRGCRSALMILDLDGFKGFNDTFGHMCGDELLKSCGEAFKNLFRKNDIVCRLGGDEFIVFMRNIPDVDAALVKANELLTTTRAIRIKSQPEAFVSCSVGIALSPENGSTFNELYKLADIALYEAKKQGRGRFVQYRVGME